MVFAAKVGGVIAPQTSRNRQLDRGQMARKIRDEFASSDSEPEPTMCPICERAIPDDQKEKHHLIPKSKGGKTTVLLHHVCHRQIHATFTDGQLAKTFFTIDALLEDPAMQKFVTWIKTKPAGFSDAAKDSKQGAFSSRGRK